MIFGILLGLLLAAGAISIKPRRSFLADCGLGFLFTFGVSLIDKVIPYTLVGYFASLVGGLVLLVVFLIILAILPEVEEL